MAQKYLPEIITGDKRILVIDGKVVPYCLARIPTKGEFSWQSGCRWFRTGANHYLTATCGLRSKSRLHW